MENKVIQDRLALLRKKMQEEGIDFYMMPTADFHNSEYVNDYFKVREYFCNFTGSNGTLLVWKDGAGLWTDGRYFIQAEAELEGTCVELFRMLQEGVPTIEEFLEQNMQQGQTLGFDGRVIAAMDGKKYEKVLEKKQIRIAYEKDLAESIWTDRPDFPAGKVTVLDEKIAGKSVEEKLTETREKMAKDGANALLLTKLDDLMWLFNIRGCDVECNPVAMSYAYITEDAATLFIQQKALDAQATEYLAAHHIEVKEYGTIVDFLKALPVGNAILMDNRYCSYTLYKTLQKDQKPVEGKNPTELLKAIKNPVELARMQEIFLKDSVADHRRLQVQCSHDALRGNSGELCDTGTGRDASGRFRRTVSGRYHRCDQNHRIRPHFRGNQKALHHGSSSGHAVDPCPLALRLYRTESGYSGETAHLGYGY